MTGRRNMTRVLTLTAMALILCTGLVAQERRRRAKSAAKKPTPGPSTER